MAGAPAGRHPLTSVSRLCCWPGTRPGGCARTGPGRWLWSRGRGHRRGRRRFRVSARGGADPRRRPAWLVPRRAGGVLSGPGWRHAAAVRQRIVRWADRSALVPNARAWGFWAQPAWHRPRARHVVLDGIALVASRGELVTILIVGAHGALGIAAEAGKAAAARDDLAGRGRRHATPCRDGRRPIPTATS
jgi:hypothetical protein